MHYTSSFSDFSLLQLRELLINGPDAKHHDNLQGTVFEDTVDLEIFVVKIFSWFARVAG